MTRLLRIEFPGAVYYVTSRGDRREPIFEDDEDRRGLLEVVAQAMDHVIPKVPVRQWVLSFPISLRRLRIS